ncbi:hypothetical protein EHP00_1026 [Ecytonucleospora hepatopenaei]|uniref:Uncharacterized protein n=1 Tax=Ecytonucleospora hepatopenaei TaxID=646526 RepID=A0A1W0E524_9MICR|nr:hypothetical protein EHP00_1026 [Ecytonucleospora hepatopenaei]
MRSKKEIIKEKWDTLIKYKRDLCEYENKPVDESKERINELNAKVATVYREIEKKMLSVEFCSIKKPIEINLDKLNDYKNVINLGFCVICSCFNEKGVFLATKTIKGQIDKANFDINDKSDILYFSFETKNTVIICKDIPLVVKMVVSKNMLFCLQNGKLHVYDIKINYKENNLMSMFSKHNLIGFDVLEENIVVSDGYFVYMLVFMDHNFTIKFQTEFKIKNFVIDVYFIVSDEILIKTAPGRCFIFDGKLKYKELFKQKYGIEEIKIWNGHVFHKFYHFDNFEITQRKGKINAFNRHVEPFTFNEKVFVQYLSGKKTFKCGTVNIVNFISQKHFVIIGSYIKDTNIFVILETGLIFYFNVFVSLKDILEK